MAKSRKCCIICRSCRNENLTYHRFPSNREICHAWCHSIGLIINNLPKCPYVCSKHFWARVIIKERKRTYIYQYAVPRTNLKSSAVAKRTSGCSSKTTRISTASEIETLRPADLQRSSSTETARTVTISETGNQGLTSSLKKLSVEEQVLELTSDYQDDQLKGSFSTDTASFSSSRTLSAAKIESERHDTLQESKENLPMTDDQLEGSFSTDTASLLTSRTLTASEIGSEALNHQLN